MNRHKLSNFQGGWFVGSFSPTLAPLEQCEVACKTYRAGDSEPAHVHRVATELTLVASGKVRMNGMEFLAGDILEVLPGESCRFEALEDTLTVVVKSPSVAGDKYLAETIG